MAKISKREAMPMQPAEQRIKNFSEVALGYTKDQAVLEASRCLNCKAKPCVSGCPVGINIPEFIKHIANSQMQAAYEEISKASLLPAVCGRVCPQENQCESKCTLLKLGEPIAIGRLERFVADNHLQNFEGSQISVEKNNIKVAVVGSGPSGLSCAATLAGLGYSVTIFEALHTAGGVLVYGIPEFRLPKKIVAQEVENLKNLGVEILTNVIIGKTLTVDELFEMGYRAVFIGSGAGLPRFMGIPGESFKGVYSANEFLTRSNLMKAYLDAPVTPVMKGGRVAVVGGGNVAMDAARTALRLGAEKVYVVYRRSKDELPARAEEVEHAIEEGVEFKFLTDPVEILGYNNPNDPKDIKNGFVSGIKCIKMQLGEPDERGRRSPVPIENSEESFEVDTVIVSIGTSPNPLIKSTTEGLEVNSRGGIIVDENGLSSKSGVYAGGDAVTGAATVISAMGAGKQAALAIHNSISKENNFNK